MSQLTVFLARSIGLFTILLVVCFLARGGAVIETTAADGPVMLSYAIISLAMGVAMTRQRRPAGRWRPDWLHDAGYPGTLFSGIG